GAAVAWANVADDDYFTDSDGALIGLGSQSYISDTFVISENMDVSGSVSISVVLAALSSGNLYLERETTAGSGEWEVVASDSFSLVAGALGTVASIDLSTVEFTEGTYRVRAT